MGNVQYKLCERVTIDGAEEAGTSVDRLDPSPDDSGDDISPDQDNRPSLPVIVAPTRRVRRLPSSTMTSPEMAGPSYMGQLAGLDVVGALGGAGPDPGQCLMDFLQQHHVLSPTFGSPQSMLTELLALHALLSREDLPSQTHLEALVKLKDLVLEGEEMRERMATDMLTMGFPGIFVQIARHYMQLLACTCDQVEEEKARLQVLELAYQVVVKVTDKSAAFCRAVTEGGLVQATVSTLAKEDFQNKCSSEVMPAFTWCCTPCKVLMHSQYIVVFVFQMYCGAASWMLELIGNCYDDLPRGSAIREECKAVVAPFLELGNEAVKMKVCSA